MTRFARAKGSKASNEKKPEDSTPWAVMQEQLTRSETERQESKKRQEAEQQRVQNYETFLQERKIQKRNNTWFDFPEEEIKPKKQKLLSSDKEKDFKFGKRHKLTKEKHNVQMRQDKKVVESKKSEQGTSNTDNKVNKAKKKKVKKFKKISNPDTLSEELNNDETPAPNLTTSDFNTEDVKNKKHKNYINKSVAEKSDNKADTKKNTQKFKNKKKEKVEGQPLRRKPLNERSFELIINGKKVELLRFDGFPVMKKDADRLQELKNSMIKEGIPKSEVQRTIKLERRKAEKALARLKKDVCYKCRKGGHNLSDCPEINSTTSGVDVADGVCFKCGSTEHSQFECKVQKDQVFRFASCFICKEQGHIARQCPDNPRGLYPNGGACKLCGDVTHLRKDCPTIHDKREDSNIRLETFRSHENFENVEQKNESLNNNMTVIKKVKKIKF